ncbi:hypothetical protein KBW71_11375 [Hydrogenophaga aromaticivorans]|uniref:hypothetical protein n=1 Tax=Hydrogenophaga aromaticivorans TaxID=2610898 RepID=UPI001B35ABC4|nr:hypothetical protein [Hydrogenophaga aromaticivorans]MBQ0919037.1 hypothetical protein [Hydrogenophaga aromaticivorans]
MKHISQDSFNFLNRRRLLGQWALGGAAALALVACGGGDGGDDSGGIDLRAAYDRVVEGMSVAQVTRAVGREPSEISSVSTGVGGLFWSDGNGQQLHVGIGDVTQTTTYVRWDRLTSPVATLRKDFT